MGDRLSAVVTERLAGPSYRPAAAAAAASGLLEDLMNRIKEERHPTPKPSEGNTVTAQGENQAPKARMPHERDESADSQASQEPTARRMGRIAHDDLAEGQQDTGKAKETDATYRRLRDGTSGKP